MIHFDKAFDLMENLADKLEETLWYEYNVEVNGIRQLHFDFFCRLGNLRITCDGPYVVRTKQRCATLMVEALVASGFSVKDKYVFATMTPELNNTAVLDLRKICNNLSMSEPTFELKHSALPDEQQGFLYEARAGGYVCGAVAETKQKARQKAAAGLSQLLEDNKERMKEYNDLIVYDMLEPLWNRRPKKPSKEELRRVAEEEAAKQLLLKRARHRRERRARIRNRRRALEAARLKKANAQIPTEDTTEPHTRNVRHTGRTKQSRHPSHTLQPRQAENPRKRLQPKHLRAARNSRPINTRRTRR